MTKTIKPNWQEWNDLYQAAADFKRSACWEWMYDNDIFGVVDPETGETAYCCIMGNAGEHFAVAGYLGDDGLEGILKLLSGEIESESYDSMFIQDCLMCSFEDRTLLTKEDLKIIKELELKFRGRNAWPCFRRFEPGFFPWSIDADQCRLLIHILRQALVVSMRCRTSKDFLEHATPFTFLTRVFQTSATCDGEWVDQYQTAKPFERVYVSFCIGDEIRLKKLRAIKPKRNLILEADIFYTPTPVREEDRPFYPKIGILIDQQDGLAVGYEMFQDMEQEGYKCIDMLVNFIEQNNLMPSMILVAREETYYLFHEACKQLGLTIKLVDNLKFVDEFRAGMMDMITC